MNARLESLARDKQALLDRSSLCRVHLRRESRNLRESLAWSRASVAVAAAPAVQAIGWSLALSFLGAGRMARLLRFAGRAILVVKLARVAIDYAHKPARRAYGLP